MGISASRKVQIAIGAQPGPLYKALATAKTKLGVFGRDARSALGRTAGAFGSLGRGINSAIGGIGGPLLALGSISGMASLFTQANQYEEALTRLGIASNRTPAQMEKLSQSFNQVSNSTGIARETLVAGAHQFVSITGDIQTAEENLRLFAEVARGTGAAMEDVASVGASLKDNLNIPASEFRQGFDVLISQGKAGAIELKQLAEELSSLAPSYAQFKGGMGVGGLSDMGAALQATRKGFGTSSEAATGFASLMNAVNKKAGQFQAAGIKLYTKNTKTGKKELRGFLEIMDDIANSKLAKDPAKLTKAFGSAEAKRAYDQIVLNRAAIGEMATGFLDSGQTAKDFASFQSSSAGKIQGAWNRVKNSLAAAFTPDRIEAVANAIGEIPHIASAAVMMFEDMAKWLMSIVDTLIRAKDVVKGLVTDTPMQVAKQKLLEDHTKKTNARIIASGKNESGWVTSNNKPTPKRAAGETPVQVNTTVKVGADAVVKASGKAKTHRNRPGGEG